MRLAIDPRLARLLPRWPRNSLLSVTELSLLALLAVQCARLFWAMVTPVAPLGDWRPASAIDPASARVALTSGFDPFFRLGRTEGPTVVTSLQLKLFGVRVDEATGRGSAIVAGPDGVQVSYAVGEAIQPGVTLKAVSFDSVVIARGGADETLYLDQSGAAPVAVPPNPVTSGASGQSSVPGGVTLSDLQERLNLAPRMAGGRMTGLVSRADPVFLGTLGLRPGDVIVQVAGRPIGGPEDLQRAAAGLVRGGNLSIAVERGAQILPIAIAISGK